MLFIFWTPLQSLHVGSTSCELNFALLACNLSVPVNSFAFTIAFCEAKGECLLPAQTWWGTLLGFSCNCRYFRVDFSLTSLFVLLFQNSAIPCLHCYLPVFYLLDVAYVFKQEFGTWEVIFMKYIFDLDKPAVAVVCFDG